jgi:hypothetical protein
MEVQPDAPQQQDNVQYLPQPPAPVEAGPSTPAPNDQSVYAPGVWMYRTDRYLWRPGFWIDYRPGWVWIPAHYVWTPVGYVFVDGYWDLEMTRRGLVFAPVYFRRPVWTLASWSYQPSYIVYNDFLLGAMFVRPNAYSYYFGDYFDASYRRRGFIAWVDFRLGGVGYDPLFSYYRWRHRDDRRAIADLRELYAARFSGRAERPPVTLVQQNVLIQNIQNNRVTNVTNIGHVTALAPLSGVNRSVVNLQPVPRAQRLQEQKFAQNVRQAGVNRGKMETQLLASQSVPSARNPRPITARVDVPRPQVSANAAALQPPPAPRNPAGGLLSRPEANRPTGIGGREDMQRPSTPPQPDLHNRPQNEPRPENRPPVRTEPRNQPQNQPRPENRPPARAEPKNEPMPQNPPRVEPRPENRPPVRAEPRNQPAPQNPPRAEPRPAPRAEPPRPPARPPMPPPNDKKGDKKG